MDKQGHQVLATCLEALDPLNRTQAAFVIEMLRQSIAEQRSVHDDEKSPEPPCAVPEVTMGALGVDNAIPSVIVKPNQGDLGNPLTSNLREPYTMFPTRADGFQVLPSTEGPSNPLEVRKEPSLALENRTKFPEAVAYPRSFSTGSASKWGGLRMTSSRSLGMQILDHNAKDKYSRLRARYFRSFR